MLFRSSREWTDNLSHEMTIQVRPSANRDIEADVTKAADLAQRNPAVAHVRIITRSQAQSMLEPWFGKGFDLGDLPVPRMIVLEMRGSPVFDSDNFRKALRAITPAATLDDHRLWLDRLASVVRSLLLIMSLVLTLILCAMAMAVAFATRGAMAGNKEIVEILHFVGATDSFIAKEFQRHFFYLGMRGGTIGVISTLAAFSAFALGSKWWSHHAPSDQMEAFFSSFSLDRTGYASVLLVGAGIALLTGAVSRIIVFRHLRGLE